MLQGEDYLLNPSHHLLAMGANIRSSSGSPEETIRAALAKLCENSLSVVAVSDLFSTPAFPLGSGPDYINSAAIIAADMQPEAILATLLKVESYFGRQRNTRWGSRTLDLDLIASGDRICPDAQTVNHWINLSPEQQQTTTPDQLILPHPRIQDRAFVLIPLAQIAPDWRHPILGKTVREMADALPLADKTAVKPL